MPNRPEFRQEFNEPRNVAEFCCEDWGDDVIFLLYFFYLRSLVHIFSILLLNIILLAGHTLDGPFLYQIKQYETENHN